MPLWKDPKTGKYRYQFQHLGKRYSKTGFATQKAAGIAMGKHQKELEDQDQTPPSLPTPSVSASEPLDLEALMVKYLRLAERGLAEKTLTYRKTVFKRFLAHVGNIPATDITADQVEDYLLTRPTNNNFNKDRTELMRLFSWAHHRLLLPHNPVYLVEKLSVDRTQKVIPSPQAMAKILVAAGPDRPLLLEISTPWPGLTRFCALSGRT